MIKNRWNGSLKRKVELVTRTVRQQVGVIGSLSLTPIEDFYKCSNALNCII